MDKLELLRRVNPHIIIHSVKEEAFRRFGNYIPGDTAAICAAAEAAVAFPEAGSAYHASVEALEKLPEMNSLREMLCGGLDEQFGLCLGHSNRMNALEWHTCNEINIAVRDLVLLLAKRSDLDENCRLDADKVEAFYLAAGETVEVYADTLHFCPCEVSKGGFSCIVGLQRGTNQPMTPEQRKAQLWGYNKWLIAHEDNTDLVQRGAYPGISGQNWTIHTID